MKSLKLFILVSLILTAMSALFCYVAYSLTGSVPKIHSVHLLKNYAVELSFSVSRWWDMLFCLLWSAMFVLVFNVKKVKNNENFLFESIVLGISLGCIISLNSIMGIFYGAITFLTAGFVVGFIASLIIYMGFGPGAGLGAFLSSMLTVGIKEGYLIGFLNGLMLGLGTCIGVSLGMTFKKLKQKFKRKQIS